MSEILSCVWAVVGGIIGLLILYYSEDFTEWDWNLFDIRNLITKIGLFIIMGPCAWIAIIGCAVFFLIGALIGAIHTLFER